jgi:methionyl-tRNA formyltransferase
MRTVVFCSAKSDLLVALMRTQLDIVGVVAYGPAPGRLEAASRRWLHGLRDPVRFARKRGIPARRCQAIDDPGLASWLEAIPHDVLVVYRTPILPPSLYCHARYAINLHPSLLPAYRGGHPLLWAVWDDHAETGCTVHLLEETADTGAIVCQRRFSIPRGVSERELERTAELAHGAPAIVEAVERLQRGICPEPQPANSPTAYARRRKRRQIWADIPFQQWSAERVWRVLRFTGLTPVEVNGDDGTLLEWKVGELEPRAGAGRPGSLQYDWRGYYVSHPQGRIRLRPRVPARRLIGRGIAALRRLSRPSLARTTFEG